MLNISILLDEIIGKYFIIYLYYEISIILCIGYVIDASTSVRTHKQTCLQLLYVSLIHETVG